MLRALLLDLDDTLLINDWDAFYPPYLRLLMEHMHDVVPPARFAAAFDAASEAMIRSDGSQGTLDQVFMNTFVAHTGCDPKMARARFDAFYTGPFEQLQSLTAPDPAALDLVMLARERGYKLAIATQPLFPREAVLARLRWAGVPDKAVAYDYLATFDQLTVCKPRRGYFQTILDALAVAPGEAIMVGDSARADMAAARLGIKTFYV